MSTYKDKLNEMIEDLQQENQQLKELLKQARPMIIVNGYFSASEYNKMHNLLCEIDKAIGEKK